ncbi:MAG TPA: OmpA family protein [Candidatus Sulfopaludibacter sp.]|jgi:outer membrane protein OmpA-like peptidoglycan-associated protein|nr:OmpA family protein [Candidatus Sulfopaludibacter sp.]
MRATFAALFVLAASAFGQSVVSEPPAELSFLTGIWNVRKNIPHEAWNEVKFPPNRDTGPARQGKHWYIIADTGKKTNAVTEWDAAKPAFLKNGWTVAKEYRAGGFLEVLHYSQNGVEAWINLDDDGFPVIFRLDVIEVAPPPISLTLAAPAATPEQMAPDTGDFPYLMPLPGSKFHRGIPDNGSFFVTPKGATQQELVATHSLVRDYYFPALSNLMLVSVYRDAFTKAGWLIAEDHTSILKAHYGKNGRNIWAYLSPVEAGFSIIVADAGSDLGGSLAKTCHVALYGVLFDFNKSTLQPTSDGVLQQVASLLTADKALKLEVQGHTDNVGNDAYNQTLSEARAKAVQSWLVQHSVGADRLTAKGYGKTKPVADNGSDEGRSKNRRVEIADPRCTAKAN